jgi:uncharacterized Zn finger protein
MTDGPDPNPRSHPAAAGVHAATIFCEVCGEETPHRVVHLDPAQRRVVSGLARCRTCRTTHPFRVEPPPEHALFEIVSDGELSTRTLRSVPALEQLTLGERFPGRDPPAVIHKIDRLDGRPARSAVARDVRTVWLTLDVGAVVKVSMVDGRRTTATRLTLPPDTMLAVGGPITIDGRTWHISALRARGRTWRHEEDQFAAMYVERLYARRYAIPPEGSNDWSRSRERPLSRTSSTSRSARSRSGPGVRR